MYGLTSEGFLPVVPFNNMKLLFVAVLQTLFSLLFQVLLSWSELGWIDDVWIL